MPDNSRNDNENIQPTKATRQKSDSKSEFLDSSDNSALPKGQFTAEIRISSLMPPHLIAEYEKVCPGFAKDFHNNFMEQQNHRRWCEKSTIEAAIDYNRSQLKMVAKGQSFAMWSFVGVLVSGIVLAYLGYPQIAYYPFGMAFIVLVTGLMYSPFNRFPWSWRKKKNANKTKN